MIPGARGTLLKQASQAARATNIIVPGGALASHNVPAFPVQQVSRT